jgi:D-glycerate 3-kinase
MQLEALLEKLTDASDRDMATGAARSQIASVLEVLPQDAPSDWRHLAAGLAVVQAGASGVQVLGISGGQGAGKSTLAGLLVAASGALGRRALALSLDDFYLTRAEREDLGREVHPLLRTRGVPGTHDVALAVATIDRLRRGERAEVPGFDKSIDDRALESRTIQGPLDLIIFEGWCVGAAAEPEVRLRSPINELERAEDPDGVWRRYVNGMLETDYPPLWHRIDRLLYLKVPDLEAVIRWRTEQEQAHPPDRRMTSAQIKRFVAHYERLTRWMINTVGEQADLVGLLGDDHELTDLSVNVT